MRRGRRRRGRCSRRRRRRRVRRRRVGRLGAARRRRQRPRHAPDQGQRRLDALPHARQPLLQGHQGRGVVRHREPTPRPLASASPAPQQGRRGETTDGSEDQPVRLPPRCEHRLEEPLVQRARVPEVPHRGLEDPPGDHGQARVGGDQPDRDRAHPRQGPRRRPHRPPGHRDRSSWRPGRRAAHDDHRRSPAIRRSSSTSSRSRPPSSTPRSSRRASPTSSPAASPSGVP